MVSAEFNGFMSKPVNCFYEYNEQSGCSVETIDNKHEKQVKTIYSHASHDKAGISVPKKIPEKSGKHPQKQGRSDIIYIDLFSFYIIYK